MTSTPIPTPLGRHSGLEGEKIYYPISTLPEHLHSTSLSHAKTT